MSQINEAINGLETLPANGGRASRGLLTSQQIANLANASNFAFNTNPATASTTLSAANVSGAASEVVLALTGAITGAATATLPSAAAVSAANPLIIPGQSYKLRVINQTAAETWTIAAGAGWTLSGTMTIAGATWREFIVTFPSVNTATTAASATLQDVGGSTII
jgi:hypothetical protein